MKTKLILISLFLLATAPVWAGASLDFSTVTGSGDSWTITNSGGAYTMTFGSLAAKKVNVDGSDPVDAAILGDYLHLPDMALTIITDSGGQINGLLTPVSGQSLTITDQALVGNQGTVMTADVTTGAFLTIGSNYMAFSIIKDNLNITQYLAGYSAVIDEFVVIDTTLGGELDLSFTGNSTTNIYNFLHNGTGTSIGGVIDGQINGMYIPAPGAILLGGIGVSLVGWLRRRRTL